MARKKVASSGYQYVKGRSWAKGVISEDEQPRKRPKIDAEERACEVKHLQDNLDTLTSSLRYKQQMLEKAHTLNSFEQCDEISGQY